MTGVFCDKLDVTVPVEHRDLLDRLRPFLDVAGFAVDWDADSRLVLRSPNDGTVVWAKRFGVMCLGVSGAACAALRSAGQWMGFLAEIGATPHRVTRLDATLDVIAHAPPEVVRVRRLGAKGKLKLTRKAVKPEHVESHLSLCSLAAVETGTVYVGSKQADVRLVVYDKRHERFKATGVDVGPLTRYELRLRSGACVTLRDVAEPAAVFWHHMGRGALSAPADAPAWSSEAEGYRIERGEAPSAFQRLTARVEASAEVLALAKLAAELGPYGVEVLVSEIRKVAGRSDSSMGTRPLARAARASAPVNDQGNNRAQVEAAH